MTKRAGEAAGRARWAKRERYEGQLRPLTYSEGAERTRNTYAAAGIDFNFDATGRLRVAILSHMGRKSVKSRKKKGVRNHFFSWSRIACAWSRLLLLGIPDDGAESLQHSLYRLGRHCAEGFHDVAFGKGKDFVESDPTEFRKRPLNQVSRPNLKGGILLFD
jgi:hypothetical protein